MLRLYKGFGYPTNLIYTSNQQRQIIYDEVKYFHQVHNS